MIHSPIQNRTNPVWFDYVKVGGVLKGRVLWIFKIKDHNGANSAKKDKKTFKFRDDILVEVQPETIGA